MSFDIFTYSEKSARAKLARQRARGDTSQSMICIDGLWYVGTHDNTQKDDHDDNE